MARSKGLSTVQRILWVVGIVAAALIATGVGLAIQRNLVTAKFEPIATLPPAIVYNLDLASSDIKTAYSQLEQSYIALAKNPADVDAALSRAKAFLGIKDTARAILAYQWVARQYPSNVQSWVGLADIYATVGRIDDAKTAYQNALQLEPNNSAVQDKINKLGGKS
jgi:cytochrome c-type biogenesis protein CcmH/NrfG